MKTIEEKAMELFPNKSIEESISQQDEWTGNEIQQLKREFYVHGYKEGRAEANAEWQEKVRLSTLLIRISVDDLKTANYEIDRRGLYKVIYDALEIIGKK